MAIFTYYLPIGMLFCIFHNLFNRLQLYNKICRVVSLISIELKDNTESKLKIDQNEKESDFLCAFVWVAIHVRTKRNYIIKHKRTQCPDEYRCKNIVL